MNDSQEPSPQFLQINLPDRVTDGYFADFASIWHTDNVFVLDFVALTQPPFSGQGPMGEEGQIVPGRVVSRIRIPPEQVFEVARALTQQLEAWEQETGRKPPTRPLFGTDGREILFGTEPIGDTDDDSGRPGRNSDPA